MAEGAVRSVVKKATSSVTKLNARPLLTEATATAATDISNAAGFISNVKQVDKPKALQELQGPTGYPIVGTATEYFRKENRGKMHEVQRQFHQKYGKMFKERLGSVTNVSIADPKLVEDLLRKEGKYPLRPPYASWLLYKKLRKQKCGIMSSTGEEWLKNRQAMSQKLLRPKVIGEYVDVMNEVVGSLIDRIKYVRDHHSNGKTVPELPNELSKWATESVAMVLLEERLGCLDKTVRPESQEFINSVGTMFLTGHQLMVFAEVHKALGTRPWKRHVAAWDTIYDFATELIDKKLTEIKEIDDKDYPSDNNTRRGSDFLRYLLGNKKLSVDEIYTNTTELLLSGVDTSSNALGFILYNLANSPRVQEKLQNQIDKSLGRDWCSYEALQNLPYVKAIVKESLRLHPVLPINARVTTEDTVLNGYLIPKDTCILFNIYTMGRDEKYFSNPDEFYPERWLRDEVKDWNPFTVLPFGFGSRSCVGRRIAEQELYLALVRMAQKFWLNPSKELPFKPMVRTVLTFEKDIPVEFVDR